MKEQLLGKIARYRIFLQQGLSIPDENGDDLRCIDFNFDKYIEQQLQIEQEQNIDQDDKKIELIDKKITELDLKLNDLDLEGLLKDLENIMFDGEIDFTKQNIGDQTAIRLSVLIQKLPISSLILSDTKISYIGGLELGKAIKNSKLRKLILTNCNLGHSSNILMEQLHFLEEVDFGVLGNRALRYLSQQKHELLHLGFQEDPKEVWDAKTKELFLVSIPKSLLSIQFQIDNADHKKFIGIAEIKCQENRDAYLRKKANEYKSKDLDPDHPEYYDCDDFKVNAFKFSVKSYLSNVFESLLDESLYYLEKERQNVLRDEAIYQVTKELLPQSIMEDICQADGSLIVLAKYLLTKIKK
ncbi:unnamed protein product [Paramecium sonneborni]|uniref:Uncharacterized protein n=1 Tax=Paramecium sonneborni TaxID=65129 RepID=A0A8S1MFE3_9CILI|nr:unnamed protein product [Paramecium sonneborni]